MDESVYERAQHATELATRDAIARQQRRPAEAPAFDDDGNRVCVDCDDPIDPRRVAACPEAVRCIDCQQFVEQRALTG